MAAAVHDLTTKVGESGQVTKGSGATVPLDAALRRLMYKTAKILPAARVI